MNTMYSESVKQISPFVGCKFDCSYCKPSFQRQAKRQKHRCMKCYNYEPHFHPERLNQYVPKTNDGEFVFCCQMGDISFATAEEMFEIIEWMAYHPDTTFLLQSKDPICFVDCDFSDNVILGTTIETDISSIVASISKAPLPINRYHAMQNVNHLRKAIIVEPCLTFTSELAVWIRQLNPEFVYVGYDTKNCKLPEPALSEIKGFISGLGYCGIPVRQKTIRKAWWEA